MPRSAPSRHPSAGRSPRRGMALEFAASALTSRGGASHMRAGVREVIRMSNGYLTGLIGGAPGAVALRLIVVSFIVGLILAMFGYDPQTIYESFQRGVRRLIE